MMAFNHQNIWHTLQAMIRRKRFAFFRFLLSSLPHSFCILDIGGTQAFWEQVGFVEERVQIVVYNLSREEIAYPSMVSMAGDARDMHMFADQQFEIVFSNSVIEHVGTYYQQGLMAREVRRVGQRYCVQTPNRYFPIEPHVLLPFFQFLPFNLQVFILCHCRSPWGWKIGSKQEVIEYVSSIRLLTESELHNLFPGASIYKEKFLGLTKSFIVYDGWYR